MQKNNTNILFVTNILKWSPSLNHQHDDVTNITVTAKIISQHIGYHSVNRLTSHITLSYCTVIYFVYTLLISLIKLFLNLYSFVRHGLKSISYRLYHIVYMLYFDKNYTSKQASTEI